MPVAGSASLITATLRVVAVRAQRDALPIARLGSGSGIIVGVEHRVAVGIESGADGVVGQGSEHDGVSGHAEHLNRAADAVGDLQRPAGGRKAGGGPAELDNQASRQLLWSRSPP